MYAKPHRKHEGIPRAALPTMMACDTSQHVTHDEDIYHCYVRGAVFEISHVSECSLELSVYSKRLKYVSNHFGYFASEKAIAAIVKLAILPEKFYTKGLFLVTTPVICDKDSHFLSIFAFHIEKKHAPFWFFVTFLFKLPSQLIILCQHQAASLLNFR